MVPTVYRRTDRGMEPVGCGCALGLIEIIQIILLIAMACYVYATS